MSNSIELGSEGKFSDLVLTEIQLRSLLESYRNSEGWWIALPGTPTLGDIAIPQLNLTVWPAAIRSQIKSKLVQMGGVPLESPLIWTIDSEGNLSAQPATKPVEDDLHAMNAELVTDDNETQ